MNIFDFRNQLIDDYASYINSFIQIRDPQINHYVQQKLYERPGQQPAQGDDEMLYNRNDRPYYKQCHLVLHRA